MSDNNQPPVGAISWMDLTTDNAEAIREFYEAVVGWKAEAVSMDDYNDYNMIMPTTNEPMAGICHAKGVNAGLPPQWLMYVSVKNLEESMKQCEEKGGTILLGPKPMGSHGIYCIIQDPIGAVAALFQSVADGTQL